MMSFHCASPSRPAGAAFLLALCFGIAEARPAAANVIYDFSLTANGSAGAIDIQLNGSTFLPVAGIQIYPLAGPLVTSFSSETPVSGAISIAGMDVQAGATLFGIDLFSPVGTAVLFNSNYPVDFFVFGRTPNQAGTFLSSSGNVVSSLALNTATPTATLTVTDTSAIPEPATASLLVPGILALVGGRGLRRARTRNISASFETLTD